MPQQRRLRRRPPRRGPQDPGHLRGGARRVLPLQRRRQLQRRGIGARTGRPRRGHQLVEPAGAVAADPAVQGVARIAHRRPERVGVLTGGDLADQPATRLRRQPGIQRRADQLIAEQPDRVTSLASLLFLGTDDTHSCLGDAAQTRCRAVIPATMTDPRRERQGQLVLGDPAPAPAAIPAPAAAHRCTATADPRRRHRTDHRPVAETRRDRRPRRTDRGQHVPAPRPGRPRYRHVNPRSDRDRR